MSDLDEWSRRLADAFDEAASQLENEQELREHVHPVVLQAVADLYGMRSRVATSGGRRASRSGPRRFYDRLYGGVTVEWEWRMDTSRREHGAAQALEYLHLIRSEQHHPDAFTAVVADGRRWGFLIVDPQGADDDLFTAHPETATEHFVWRENGPGACRQFLELIGSHRQAPVTARTLTTTFGPDSQLAHRVVSVLAQSLAARDDHDRADTLYREWRRALDVVYGDLDQAEGRLAEVVQEAYDVPIARSVGEILFVLHTYFALVARLIAVELLATSANDPEARPTAWRGLSDRHLLRRLAGLDRGDLPVAMEITNLFESDLFSWWVGVAEGNADLLGAIRELLAAMDGLAFPRVVFGPAPAGDVLRDLYQSLVPRELRRALGEFLTPTWLAQACLERLASSGADLSDGRTLDPTCGTGTFLLPILTRRLRRLQAQNATPTAEDVQAVLNTVCGVDLNPVAVTAARVNYVIALGDLAAVGAITLPVWRADSLLVPDAPPAQGQLGPLVGLAYREIATSLPDPFPIPLTMARADRLPHLRFLLHEWLPATTADGKLPADIDDRRGGYLAALDSEFGPEGITPATSDHDGWNVERRVAAVLYDQLAALASAGRNGVWARIIENAFAPLFAGRFDIVVGNPPWLTWTRLPDEWRNASQRVWRRYGLWRVPAEVRGAFSLASTDLATLVFAVALDRYVRDGAWVGLLTPDSLLIADPGGRAFRQFRLRPDRRDETTDMVDVPFAITSVDDWSLVRPFAPEAANRPVFIVARKGGEQQATTPAVRWARAGGPLGHTWQEARTRLRQTQGTYRPVDPAIPTSAWSFQPTEAPPLISGGSNDWAFGKGLDTRGANGVYFVRIVDTDRAHGKVVIENLPEEGRNRDVERTRGTVESRLVYPLLRGRDVQAWTTRPSIYFLLPHDPDALGNVLPSVHLRSEYPGVNRWLRRHHETLTERRVPPTRNWRMDHDDWCRVDGPLQHMGGDHLVVVRELQARPAAAIVEARMDYNLGRITAPLIDHKLLFCSVPSRDEALYLVAVINSTPMQDLLASFANQTAVSPTTLRRLPIPDFDPDRGEVEELLKLARQIIEDEHPARAAEPHQAEFDQLVLRLLDVERYQAQPRRARQRRPSSTRTSAGETLF